MKRWFSKPSSTDPSTAEPTGERPAIDVERMPNPLWVERAFLLLLWRPPGERDGADSLRALEAGQSRKEVIARLLVAAEFRLLVEGLKDGFINDVRPARQLEEALAAIGDDREFVDQAYAFILGRPADPGGGGYYLSQLKWGKSRTLVLKTLLLSDEFAARYQALAPQAGFIPRDVQLCELANPAKWDNPEWRALLNSLKVVPPDKLSMHRKGYEFTQLLFGLSQLKALGAEARILSVGAGHEPVLYWLANHARLVVATDMYGGLWQEAGAMEGDQGVFSKPEQFAPFPYARERLQFLKMDGRVLAFKTESFDVVYSLSSIEHFGGFDGARACIDDMTRVLRPGGILAIATEYCLAGPPHHEAFQPADVHRLLEHPQLELVEPIDEGVWKRYEYEPVDLNVNRHQTPHMVVSDGGTVFTSVMAFLRKRSRD